MKEARGLATKIIVPKIDLKSLLKRPLQRSPVTEDRAGAEGDHIEQMLKELQHLDAGDLSDISGQPCLKMTPREVMLPPRKRAISCQQRVDHPAGVPSAQDLLQKSSAVQRAEVPDECQTVPKPVSWKGVVRR